MLTVILTGLGSRFPRPVDGHFDGFGVGSDLRRRCGHGDRQREALPWNRNVEELRQRGSSVVVTIFSLSVFSLRSVFPVFRRGSSSIRGRDD